MFWEFLMLGINVGAAAIAVVLGVVAGIAGVAFAAVLMIWLLNAMWQHLQNRFWAWSFLRAVEQTRKKVLAEEEARK